MFISALSINSELRFLPNHPRRCKEQRAVGPFSACLCHMRRTTSRRGEEVVPLGLCHSAEAAVGELLTHNRGHWSIESKNRRARDANLREDDSRFSSGFGPANNAGNIVCAINFTRPWTASRRLRALSRPTVTGDGGHSHASTPRCEAGIELSPLPLSVPHPSPPDSGTAPSSAGRSLHVPDRPAHRSGSNQRSDIP